MDIKELNVDLDNVLYNFTGAFAYLDGYTSVGRWIEHVQRTGKSIYEYTDPLFESYVDNGLFAVGKPCPDAYELMTNIFRLKSFYNIKINLLGALSPQLSRDKNRLIVDTKMKWLEVNNFIEYFDEFVFVDTPEDKFHQSNDKSILIDDRYETGLLFEKYNKNFILHKSSLNTLNTLQNKYQFNWSLV
jgi:hypothetical protein